MPLALATITLPLGISFFTFTQIAFLVDSYQGKVGDYDFLHYLLFVTYFPHLIAGPIIHHKQVMPQFANRKVYAVDWSNCAAGLTVLIIGLIKKVLVADNYGLIATPIFELADHGGQLRFATAWAGSIAYSLQLYFDFSGYSDMAIGLSLMFNIRLPLNFNSPYKAESIIDFWKRWHMTLSAFLRDYLYIPLGGNRRGEARRYLNLLVTMLLGGLWHGAGWTFVLWGALHGIYLVVNHGFRAVAHTVAWKGGRFGAAGRFAATGLTFACVVVGWTIFRADRIATALSMVKSMVVGCASAQCASIKVFEFATAMDARIAVSLWLAGGLAAVWLLPNTQEFLFRSGVSVPQALFGLGSAVRSPIGRLKWNPVWWCWVPLGIAAAIVVISIAFNPTSQFLYYQF
jgi:D-alanyl-lipoteichoic acid acyltransferase DltB (MBOAT superfamily)